jgi:hypothetical protein
MIYFIVQRSLEWSLNDDGTLDLFMEAWKYDFVLKTKYTYSVFLLLQKMTKVEILFSI